MSGLEFARVTQSFALVGADLGTLFGKQSAFVRLARSPCCRALAALALASAGVPLGLSSLLADFAAESWPLSFSDCGLALSAFTVVASSSAAHATLLPSMPRQAHAMINLLFMAISTVNFYWTGWVFRIIPKKIGHSPFARAALLFDGDGIAHADIAVVVYLPELRSLMVLVASWFSLVGSNGGVLGECG